MQKRNQFLTFVFLAAMAHDQSKGTHDAQFIAAYAAQIPDDNIPDDTFTSALDLVRSFEGETQSRWMILPKKPHLKRR